MSTQASLLPIARLNQVDINEFNNVISILFEPTPLLTSRLYEARPYSSYEQLLDTAKKFIDEMSYKEKLEVINSHPRIGESAAKLSAMSKVEQGAPKDSDPSELAKEEAALAQWKVWNEKYEKKHGFKFIVFVNGRSKSTLLPVVEERYNRRTEDELATGLNDMVLIAKDRARKLFQKEPRL
ncbi:hypothetical protein EV182_000606 [Spiromyces aspiralis]|uniref:Uncharacterized protein n=1 Tax=Spiromyces aspiralis TaxID=68401 RepID=A0ACC1HXT5_9FUNG|nr:hypothetical protein EV182_000606 [Spiromyces aspiralis]